jgi:signal transduction histidine kinase
LRDLTARLQAENQLEIERAQALEELNASKDRFFSIVAHDLRSPFNPLIGLARILAQTAKDSSPEEIQLMADTMYRSAQNVYGLLENLLHWARSQSGRMKYEPERLDLRVLAQQSVELLIENATGKHITLTNDLPEIWAYADPDMLDVVFRNLISNALKFTPTGGRVTLAATSTPPYVEVTVQDTGVGIAPDNLLNLFQAAKLYTTRGTEQESGTGLGLMICKEMVERHGGKIWAESVAGQGTAFKFTVPLAV